MCITYCNLYENVYILRSKYYKNFKLNLNTRTYTCIFVHMESVFAFLYYFTKFIYNFYITRIQHFFLFKYKIKHIKY